MSTRILIPVEKLECTYAALESVTSRHWYGTPQFLLLKVVEDIRNSVDTNYLDHQEALAIEQANYFLENHYWLKRVQFEFAKTFPDTLVRLEVGDIASKIAKVAYEWGADHIVMGSHDLDSHTRCALGSISEKVIRLAPCTVEIARFEKLRSMMKEEGHVSQAHLMQLAAPPRRILIPTDLSSCSEVAIDWICQVLWPQDIELRIISVIPLKHCVPSVRWFGEAGISHDNSFEMAADELAKKISRVAEYADVSKIIVEGNNVADSVAKYAAEWDADVIVMAARGHSESCGTNVGPTVLNILEKTHCSMVVVHVDAKQQVGYSWHHRASDLQAFDQSEKSLI